MSSWRDAAGKQGSSGKDAAWRLSSGTPGSSGGPTPPNGARRGGRWFKGILSGSGAVLALFLLYLMTQFIGCEQAHIYVTSSGTYSHPAFSEIIFGEEDAATLIALGAANSRLTVEQTPREINFSSLYRASNSSDRLIVYLSVHGAADESGAYFFPDSFDPDVSGSSLIRAESLWNALEEQPATQKKLVLLDVTRSPMNERLGFFQNRFLDDLEDRVRRIPNLFVISACASNETNWTSSQLGSDGRGGSVFNHFVTKGLSGEADIFQQDGRVSVLELYEYVHRHVNLWVRQNRDVAGQHPQLFPSLTDPASESNFRIVSVARGQSPAIATNTGGAETAELDSAGLTDASTTKVRLDLTACWNNLDALRKNVASAPYHLQPVRWRLVHARLMEAEQWLVRSRPDRAVPLVAETQDHIDIMRRSVSLTDLVVKSDNEFVTRNLLQFLPTSGNDDQSAQKQSGGKGLALLPAHVKTLIDAAWVPSVPASMRQDVGSLLQRVEEACHPAAGALPLIRKPMQQAVEQRRVAFDQLMLADTSQVTAAVDQAEQACDSIDAVSAAWQSAEQTLNRAHSVLPELFRWSANRRSGSTVREQIVRLLVDSFSDDRPVDFHVLAALAPTKDGSLANDYDGLEVELLMVSELTAQLQAQMFRTVDTETLDKTPEEIQKLSVDISGRLDRVRKRFNDLADSFLESQQYHVAQWRELRSLLRVPFLAANARVRVMEQQKTVAARLFATDLDVVAQIEPAPVENSMDVIWPALCSIRCLIQGEDDPSSVADLNGVWLRAWLDTTKKRSNSIPALGKEVRRAWFARRERATPQFGHQPTFREIRRKLFRADRAARTLHPTDAAFVLAEGNSAEQLRRFYLAEQSLEDARRYAEDFWADWYSTAASSCLAAAGNLYSRIPESSSATIQKRLEVLQNAGIHPRFPNAVEFGSGDNADSLATVSSDMSLPVGVSRLRVQVGQASNGITASKPFYEVPLGRNASQTVPVTFGRAVGYDAAVCELSGQVRVDFRGHQFTDKESAFPVLPCPPKGIRFRYTPAPETGAVLVDGTDRRPVLFILDASRSMTPAKMAQAQTALFKILERFNDENRVTIQKRKAAFFAFGHTKELNNNNQVRYPPKRLATWPRNQNEPDLEEVNDGLIARLRNFLADESRFKPQGNTPLRDSIIKAFSQMTTKNFSGVVVTISDGADNFSEFKNPDDEIRRLRGLAAANGIDIELHIVGFDVVDPITRQLTDEGELLRKLALGSNDRFHIAPDATKLAASLADATDPRHYTVTPRSRIQGGDVKKEPLGKPVDGLRKGKYQVSFGALPSFDIEIRGGELLKYQLGNQRLNWTTLPDDPRERVASRSGREELAVTRFVVNLKDNQAEFTICLLPGDSSTLFITRPKDILFQITPREDVSFIPRPVTWKPLAEQSFPTWEVTVKDWPGRSGASVTAYWNPRSTSWRPLSLNSDSAQAVDIGEVQGKQRNLQIESVEFKSGVPGGTEAEFFVECRVVPPLTGPITGAVFAHLEGVNLELLMDGDPIDAGLQREVIEKDGIIRATFTQLTSGDRKRYGLAVTSWTQRLVNARRPVQPLVIAKPQN
jgi:hypothetical protein